MVIQGVKLQALVDTGSTHTFIHDEMARRLGLNIAFRPGISVKVANGDCVMSPGVCRNTAVAIGKDTFNIDCFALALDGFDVVLGVKWLKTLGTVSFDFGELWMAFWRDGKPVCWQGIDGAVQPTLAIAATENLMEVLLSEYADIFSEPRGLPPPHRHDHRIHLLPDSVPVAVRPYRYLQLLKDEMEWQCADMLAQGIIRPSTSPFSSPVLLVKKPDDTWRFCVDYRTLND